MVQRPEIRLSSLSSWLSWTALAVGLTELSGLRCWAFTGAAQARMSASASAPTMKRMRVKCVAMRVPPCWPTSCVSTLLRLRRHRLAICRLPTPSAGAVAALDHALLVDLRDDLAVAGEE